MRSPAINLAKEQLRFARQARQEDIDRRNGKDVAPPVECLGTTSNSTGIPCSHMIGPCLANNHPIRLADFHDHWALCSFQRLEQYRLQVDRTFGRCNERTVQVEVRAVLVVDEDGRIKNPPARSTLTQEKALHRAKLPQKAPKVLPTKRIASAGEVADGGKKKARPCTDCSRAGHTAAKCPETAPQRAALSQRKKDAKKAARTVSNKPSFATRSGSTRSFNDFYA